MQKISYAGYRFPHEVIHQAIWLYLRFTLSFRDVEDLLAERACIDGKLPQFRPARFKDHHSLQSGPRVSIEKRDDGHTREETD